jgi:translation initiation factor IF-2
VTEKNDFNNKRNRDRINKDKLYKDKGVTQHDNDKGVKSVPKKGQFIKPKPIPVVKEDIKVIALPEVLTIKDLADKMKKPGSALIKKLFLAGKVVTINQEITYEEAEEILIEYDIIAEKEVFVNEVEELLKEEEEDSALMVKRPPVVCVMGHVDHGKTSLLDAIRHANVTSREAGGITQHIGAYMVEIKGEKITFLDTPGHEAFTSMRMRGARATDIAILVVAADDGVMPQTIEAISHAKAAGVQIIVAINKTDKASANVERVKQELTEYELIAEDWGGDTIFAPVSAQTQEGVEHLLEMILITAEMQELKANPDRMARGLVIEAELDKGRGPVVTILVQKGTLRVGDNIAVGSSYGKVRAMLDDKGRTVKEASPSTPVEILGLNTVPDVGEIFIVTDNEKEARAIADAFISQGREKLIADTKAKLSLDGLFSQIQAGNIKELNLIIKADVQGSVEAMKQSLLKLSNDEVAVRILHGGVGAINESDVILASTSNGIIIGFNVKPDNRAKEIGEHENVDIKFYSVIYNAINDVEAAMKGLLDPIFEEKIIAHAEIRQIFKASGVGTIAGSYVLDGKVIRGSSVRIYRNNQLVHEGILASLKRFQDDVREVSTGYECGLVFEKFNDVKEADKVEFYVMAEVPR